MPGLDLLARGLGRGKPVGSAAEGVRARSPGQGK